ncbi:MAG TPA: ATP-grasp domain-containing protein, partial [Flavobacteriales bacterium]|nr:ATP-grasp domain-containing protein [Flavobacteriales bacterium]
GVRESTAVETFGMEGFTEPEPVRVNLDAMLENFRIGYQQFGALWRELFSPSCFAQIEKASTIEREAFAFPLETWVMILYELAATFHAWQKNRNKLIDVVVPLCEPEIRCLSRWHHEGRALPCRVLVNPWPEVERFSDKWLTTCHLRAQGIAVPAAACEPGAKAPGWPRVVKSRSGSGSSAVLVVHDLREEAEAFSRLAPALSQAFLPGEEGEYTAALFRWEGGQHHLVFRRLLGAGGMSREVHLVDVEPWRDWLLRVGEAIGASGSWNVQFRLREGQPLPFEINPRFSSTLYFRHVFGFQDLLWSLQPERIPTSFQSRFRRGVGVRGQIAHFFDLEEA